MTSEPLSDSNLHDQSDHPGDSPVQPEKKPPKQPKVASTKQGSLKHCVEITLAVASTKGLALTVLALASGVSNESVHDVALGVVTNFARAKEVLTTSLEIADADPMESGILATMCSNEDAALFKLVWGLAGALSSSMPAQVPAQKGKAGLELAKALQSLAPDDRSALRKAGAVLA